MWEGMMLLTSEEIVVCLLLKMQSMDLMVLVKFHPISNLPFLGNVVDGELGT